VSAVLEGVLVEVAMAPKMLDPLMESWHVVCGIRAECAGLGAQCDGGHRREERETTGWCCEVTGPCRLNSICVTLR
jgi:hypothetical protein